jgi:hypothetical protein
MIQTLRQLQNAFSRSLGTLLHRMPSAITATMVAAPTASGCIIECRSLAIAWPLASRHDSITTMAAFSSGGDTVTVHAAATAAQRAVSIQRADAAP